MTRQDTQPITIPVPALVSPELFASANEQLAENKLRYRQNRRGARFLLPGLLVCPHCGYAWCGQPHGPAPGAALPVHPRGSYRCTGRMMAKRAAAPSCTASRFAPRNWTRPQQDLLRLPRFQAYLRLLIDGMPTYPFSMQTLPPPIPRRSSADPPALRRTSRHRYARSATDVERTIAAALAA